MRRGLFAALAALAVAAAGIAGAAEWPPPSPAQIPGTTERIVQAKGTGNAYRIYLSVPEQPAPSEGYPVIYLLDADSMIGTLVETVRQQSRRSDATGVSPAVVVGIGYPGGPGQAIERRWFDYTPPAPTAPAAPGAGMPSPRTGGADAFLDFILTELAPAVAEEVRINGARRAVIGHSLGGLFVLHALFSRPGAFQGYAAISPSIWWADGHILQEERAFATAADDGAGSVRLFVAVGGEEGRSRPERRMVENARELAARMTALSRPGMDVAFALFEGENHASVIPGALARALPFLVAPATPR